jgi:hypothetical protein
MLGAGEHGLIEAGGVFEARLRELRDRRTARNGVSKIYWRVSGRVCESFRPRLGDGGIYGRWHECTPIFFNFSLYYIFFFTAFLLNVRLLSLQEIPVLYSAHSPRMQ